uniref:Uncharacterized protein n=1 Tax=Mycena chlorophos TaxID=658473 RepID=A0ABQ0LEG9_MYCCL|nr:predicted protein [Mycena chlorophos]
MYAAPFVDAHCTACASLRTSGTTAKASQRYVSRRGVRVYKPWHSQADSQHSQMCRYQEHLDAAAMLSNDSETSASNDHDSTALVKVADCADESESCASSVFHQLSLYRNGYSLVRSDEGFLLLRAVFTSGHPVPGQTRLSMRVTIQRLAEWPSFVPAAS